ncbi:MAG: stage V sporulation protein T [Clostridia bacterium]|nr:stage V sporulation protein T [Clostridia bacterium]
MRATGIVRRIDELGRVVIPKEIRRTLRIREGDPLEIFTDHDGEVVLKKYSPIGEIASIAKDYTDSLYRTLGHVALISDRDAIVSSSGAAKREYIEKALSPEADQILQSRQLALLNLSSGMKMLPITADDRAENYSAQIIAPILADGEIVGGLILLSRESGLQMTNVDQKVAETTANIIGRQMEQ